ncbi:MAG: DUF1641 domain-containing protein [Tumebacillaceae bacterium]
MAKATTRIEKSIPNPIEEQAQSLGQLLQAITANKDALLLLLDIVKELHELGLLEAMQAMLKNRHDISLIGLAQLNKPGAARILKNGMNALQFLSSIDPAELEPLLKGVAGGVKYAAEADTSGQQMGLFGMVKTMRDPEVMASMQVLFHFLRGMGHEVQQSH